MISATNLNLNQKNQRRRIRLLQPPMKLKKQKVETVAKKVLQVLPRRRKGTKRKTKVAVAQLPIVNKTTQYFALLETGVQVLGNRL